MLHAQDFVEVETPTLTRSTPEGARDFVVPARLQPGSWYALPQSPQLFKQLLMVAGMERYFQIARCYRDEDFRADRQPEFTQLDVEMSFVEQDDVIALAEDVLKAVWELVGHEISTPIPRMTYAEAMARYGTDKPDLRLDLELTECTDYFKDTPFRVFQAPYVGAVVMPGGAGQPRKQLDAWQDWAKQRGAKGLAYVLVQEDGELGGPVAKNLSDAERAGLAEHVGAEPGDCVFFAAGPVKPSRALLGAARLEIGRRCNLIDESAWRFLWVVDAPLFEPAGDATAAGDVAVGSGAWTAVHHAFTSPRPECMDTFDTDPGHALAYAYDIVCNGNEIGGGSIRIHREDIQKRVFAVMGLAEEEAEEKFGFLLAGLQVRRARRTAASRSAGTGSAPCSRGTDSIRDVIAFPKTGCRLRPAHRRTRADHPGAAQGGGRGRPAGPAPGRQAQPRTADRFVAFRWYQFVTSREPNIDWPSSRVTWPRVDTGARLTRQPQRPGRPASTRKVTMGIQPTELATNDVHQDDAPVTKTVAGRSPTQIAMARLRADKIAMTCLVVVILFVLVAVFAPLISKAFGVELHAGENDTQLDQFNFPAYGPPDHGFTWKAPLGIAPNTGNDNLAEWLYGARTSLVVATVSTVVATLIGVVVGLIAGFSRGWLDRVINFFIDVFLSLPFILVALALAPIIVSRFGGERRQAGLLAVRRRCSRCSRCSAG